MPPLDDELVEQILTLPEGRTFDVKRVGDNSGKIKTITAFANTDGGVLVLGVEDSKKATGRDRVYGIQENLESVAELKRLLGHRITPVIDLPHSEPLSFIEIGCTLRDGSAGSILVVKVSKSYTVHSIVDGGTFVREDNTNRHLSASQITELSMQRGATSAVNILADVPFELLNTIYWKEYRDYRKLTRDIDQALFHLGLARKDEKGKLLPTRAAVLLFAEEPAGLLDTKCSIRIFHYKGESIEHKVETNLLRTPKSVMGPLKVQITSARDIVIDSLATGVQVGPLGFEIAQRYPVRVITEAITNAVIHRDYRISADIHIRIFANRIEIESPGVLPGGVTAYNIGIRGSHPRNRALVDHLREFPQPPNLDAGEGVRMMFETMGQAELYPPIFLTQPAISKEAVIVFLFNELRLGVWDQVYQYLLKQNDIGNAEVRKILRTDDTIKAYKTISNWVKLGLLVVSNPTAAKQNRRYRLPGATPDQGLLSKLLG
ncbi:MAG: putative DNA binding domain-containing protein [Deltaproteobacteria bacterium]|nr:putative DNA binding domain-containing protein [Deltaproteobacteria bacterium]